MTHKHYNNHVMIVFMILCTTLFTLIVTGCGSSASNSSSSQPNTAPTTATTNPTATPSTPVSNPVGSENFMIISEKTVSSDGVNSGLSAYQLITNAFGNGSIESPDLYRGNHNDVVHIYEDTDEIQGDHFVFLAHRDLDKDRDKSSIDRQRNEIKTFDPSHASLKGFLGDSVQYQWRFKVTSDMQLSNNFSHFFQIKAKNASEDNANGNDSQPIVTLSGAEKSSSGNELQVRYSSGINPTTGQVEGEYLVRTPWSLITDEWVEVLVQVTYAEAGALSLTLTRLRDQAVILDIDKNNIDMWRGNDSSDFARPKWGIYRSISDIESLRAEEEQVRFADFTIRKGTKP